VIRVWDPALRAMHWALAICVGLGWATTAWFGGWHRGVGYAASAIVVVRIAWGCIGPRHSRFAHFVRGPSATWQHAQLALRGREPRHIGHNPLGAWMAIALMACVAGLALTGWLYTTDRFWGSESVERVHRALAWAIVVLTVLHAAGVAIASLRHRENLIGAMVHGDKREAHGSDID
jgi:cytochrome b